MYAIHRLPGKSRRYASLKQKRRDHWPPRADEPVSDSACEASHFGAALVVVQLRRGVGVGRAIGIWRWFGCRERLTESQQDPDSHQDQQHGQVWPN